MVLWIYFLMYAFLGWCIEVLFYIYKTKRFVNRGFLNGPFVPIYGLSLVSLHLLLFTLFEDVYVFSINQTLIVFILIVLIASLFELIGGAVLHHLFDARWWDYSHERFHYKGYVSLRFSILWGIMGLLTFYGLHLNVIVPSIGQLNDDTLFIISLVFLLYLLLDMSFTIRSLYSFKTLLGEFKKRTDQFENAAIRWHGSLPDSIKSPIDHLRQALKNNYRFIFVLQQFERVKQGLGKVKDKTFSHDFNTFGKITERIKNTRLYKAFPELKIPYHPQIDKEDEDNE